MRTIRTVLLVVIIFWIFMMAVYPGLYDSRRSFGAHKHYFQVPSDATRHEMDEARKRDQRDIYFHEIIMTAILAAAIYGFICAGRRLESHRDKSGS